MDIISQVEKTSSNIHPLSWVHLVASPPLAPDLRVGAFTLLALACDEISGPLSYIWEDREGEGPISPALSCSLCLPVPKILGNATSLRVCGQSLRLVCVSDSNPPPM